MNPLNEFLTQRLKRGLVRRLNNLKIASVAREVSRKEPGPSGAPVVFFKASSGIDDLSWNSGFHLLASWALRLKGIPVAYFACKSGMSKCVLGTNRDDPHQEMPCKTCVYQSQTLYTNVETFKLSNVQRSSANWFDYQRDEVLTDAVAKLSVAELMEFEWQDVPLGALCLPGLRWILRIHHLSLIEKIRKLHRHIPRGQYIFTQKIARILVIFQMMNAKTPAKPGQT